MGRHLRPVAYSAVGVELKILVSEVQIALVPTRWIVRAVRRCDQLGESLQQDSRQQLVVVARMIALVKSRRLMTCRMPDPHLAVAGVSRIAVAEVVDSLPLMVPFATVVEIEAAPVVVAVVEVVGAVAPFVVSGVVLELTIELVQWILIQKPAAFAKVAAANPEASFDEVRRVGLFAAVGNRPRCAIDTTLVRRSTGGCQ